MASKIKVPKAREIWQLPKGILITPKGGLHKAATAYDRKRDKIALKKQLEGD
jgi:hypothetical protein